MSRSTRQAVSFVIRHPDDPDRILIVRRPPDDEELPNLWGLPAGRVREGETDADAIVRAGREKLGVELEVGPELNRGSTERAEYTLEMRLYEASILEGEPEVGQPHTEVTQYTEWRWGRGEDLQPAAGRGSLCCKLYVRIEGGDLGT